VTRKGAGTSRKKSSASFEAKKKKRIFRILRKRQGEKGAGESVKKKD